MSGSPLETISYRDNNAIHFIHVFPREFTFCAPEYPADMVLYNTFRQVHEKNSAWLYQLKFTAQLIAYEQESSLNKKTILYHRAFIYSDCDYRVGHFSKCQTVSYQNENDTRCTLSCATLNLKLSHWIHKLKVNCGGYFVQGFFLC